MFTSLGTEKHDIGVSLIFLFITSQRQLTQKHQVPFGPLRCSSSINKSTIRMELLQKANNGEKNKNENYMVKN